MTDTINRGYPYPRLRGDGADVSYWLQQLAEHLDLDVQELADRLTGRTKGVQSTLVLSGGFAAVSEPCTLSRVGDQVTITGRVRRTSGTGTQFALLPEEHWPISNTYSSSAATNSGGVENHNFQLQVGVTGGVTANAASGGPAWTSGTWIPFNITYLARNTA